MAAAWVARAAPTAPCSWGRRRWWGSAAPAAPKPIGPATAVVRAVAPPPVALPWAYRAGTMRTVPLRVAVAVNVPVLVTRRQELSGQRQLTLHQGKAAVQRRSSQFFREVDQSGGGPSATRKPDRGGGTLVTSGPCPDLAPPRRPRARVYLPESPHLVSGAALTARNARWTEHRWVPPRPLACPLHHRVHAPTAHPADAPAEWGGILSSGQPFATRVTPWASCPTAIRRAREHPGA